MFTRIAVLTALSLTVAACGGGDLSLETPTQLQDVTTAPASIAVDTTDQLVVGTTTPETVAPTTTIDLSNVDWEALADAPPTTNADGLTQSEIDAMATDYIDEQRMLYGRCGEWHELALSVGWPEEQWPTLSRVIYRESRCQSGAWNGSDSGLVQINKIHTEWAAQMGYVWPDDFFKPRVNLEFAYRLWLSRESAGKCGWQPWSISCD